MKVTLIDPANYGLYYNYCLIDELARQGCAVEYITTNFTYEEILKRDKTNLDIFWIKDENLDDLDSLPEPSIIAFVA